MNAAVRLDLSDELLDAIVERVVESPRLLERLAERLDHKPIDPWIRGAAEAAAYIGAKPRRIYDLIERDRLRHEHDGQILVFRRSWLDTYLEGEGA